MRRLVVSIDAVARLAEATHGRADFDLAAAAALAGLGGAAAVRASVGEDLRPIGESEVQHLRRASRGLELRIGVQPSLLKPVLEARPERRAALFALEQPATVNVGEVFLTPVL